MRVAIMNNAAIINNTLSALKQTGFNPNLLSFLNVNKDLFKIEEANTPLHALLVNKINLGELFCNTPIDLRGLTFAETGVVDLSDWQEKLGLDVVANLPKLDNESWEAVTEGDELGQHFLNMKRLTGLVTLSRNEVSLSLSENVMTVEATNSLLYTGSVDVILPE